jgi:hypothetical protein
MKIHGQAWNTLVSVSAMSSSHDDADTSLARRIANAVAAGDRDEAILLTRELERALTNTPDPWATQHHRSPHSPRSSDDTYSDAVAQHAAGHRRRTR